MNDILSFDSDMMCDDDEQLYLRLEAWLDEVIEMEDN